jgi:aminoglycoside 3'-phosphotransferase-2
VANPFDELMQEAARLEWMSEKRLICPSLVSLTSERGRNWLLMTALAGRDLATSSDLSAAQRVEILAAALKTLHQLDPASCPFDHRLPTRLQIARKRVEAGVVDEGDFDDERQGRSAVELLRYLEGNSPGASDLVVTHGDACLPNFMAHGGKFSGYVDCARLGVADRYQDMSLALRSIKFNFGERWIERFLDCYGLADLDEARLCYYTVLDELF